MKDKLLGTKSLEELKQTNPVAVSVAAFIVERDWLYVAITAFVLVVLLTSFALGEAGG